MNGLGYVLSNLVSQAMSRKPPMRKTTLKYEEVELTKSPQISVEPVQSTPDVSERFIPKTHKRQPTNSTISSHDTISVADRAKKFVRVPSMMRKPVIEEPRDRYAMAQVLESRFKHAEMIDDLKDTIEVQKNEIQRLKETQSTASHGKPLFQAYLLALQTIQADRDLPDLVSDLKSQFYKETVIPLDIQDTLESTFSDIFQLLHQAVHKNIILNDHLQQLGITVPDALLSPTDIQLYHALADKMEHIQSTPNDISILSDKIKHQMDSIEVDKWSREATTRDIESHFTVHSSHLDPHAIHSKYAKETAVATSGFQSRSPVNLYYNLSI